MGFLTRRLSAQLPCKHGSKLSLDQDTYFLIVCFINKPEVIVGNPVMYFEILGDQPEELFGFYSDLFGWNISADNAQNYGYVSTGSDQGIQGGIGHARFTGRKKVLIYISVENLTTVLDHVVELGGKVLIPPTVIDGFHFATFEDPEGNPIGLIEQTA